MKIARIFCLIVLMGGVSSCGEEFFDDARQQTNIANDNWGSTQDLERLIAGAYYGASGYAGFRGIVGLQMAHKALISDVGLLHPNGVTDDWQVDIYNRSSTRNDIDTYANMWRGAYQSVALANEVIGWVDQNGPFKDQNGPIWTNRIVGEALFLRAWVYFTLVRIHAPAYGADNQAPSIILNITPSKEGFANPPRATVQAVYDQILQDLERSITLLPEAYDVQRDPIDYQDRANRFAARFLLARVYFQMKNFAKAKEQIDQIIGSGRFALTEEPIQAWNKTGTGQKGREVVWQYIQFSTSQQQWKSTPVGSFMGFTARGNATNINDSRTISASDAFLGAAGWTPDNFTISSLPSGRPPAVLGGADNFVITDHPDLRLKQLWRAIPAGLDPRPEYTSYARTYVWCNKWNRITGVNNSLFSLPLMRSAELYLSRAVIRFRAGDRAGATADLNVVRQRAGLEPLAVGEVTENVIHVERMKELAFEEDRTYYLQALSLPIPPGDRVGTQPLPWNTTQLARPVPSAEADLNPSVRK